MSLLRKDLRALTVVAAPAVALQLASMSFGVVDVLMVGRVSRHAFDAASLGGIWIWGTLIFGMGVVFGMDPFISQAHGAKDTRGMALALQRGIVASLIVTVPIAVAWLTTARGLELLGQDPALARDAGRFVVAQVPGIAPFLVFTALRQYLVGRNIIAPSVCVLVLGNVLNAGLNWVLIFGHLGLPPMGLIGSAIATTISRVVLVVALVLWIRFRKLHEGAWQRWSRDAFSRPGLAQVFRYGFPVGVQMGLEVWAFQIALLMAGWLGDVELGAHTVVLNLASLSFMLPLGVAIGAGALVGNRIGEGDLDGARRASRLSLWLGAIIMIGSAFVFTAFRVALPRLWNPDADVQALASTILPIAGAFQLFDGIQAVGAGVLRGMGQPRPAAVFNVFGYYVLALPLAWWLATRGGMGLAGIWWGLAVGLAVIAALLVFWIFRTEPRTVVLDPN